MGQRKKGFSIYFALLHILHICLSFGLIVAVVHNQLANNSRFENLEKTCECSKGYTKAHSTVERSSMPIQTYNTSSYTSKHPGLSEQNISIPDTDISLHNKTLSKNEDHLRNRTEPTVKNTSVHIDNYKNQSLTDINEASGKLHRKENSTQKLEKWTNSSFVPNKINRTEGLNGSIDYNRNQSYIIEPTDDSLKNSTLKGRIEKLDLLYCLDELKLIVDDYLQSGKLKTFNGCKLLQGSKGERGEKGCAGTSFASPSFTTTVKNLVFNERESAYLICHAKGNPSAEITWYRNNLSISKEADDQSYRYSIEDQDITPQASYRAITYCPSEIPHPVKQSTLIIRKSNGSDTGSYVCKASNILGTSTYMIHILIRVYVQFTTIPRNITVVQGENVQMSCRASGVPTPTITWYRKDGGPMPSYYNLSNGDLHVHNITKKEEGTFTCLATNVLGSNTTEAAVIVNVFPQIKLFLSSLITVNESNTLVLPCSATGFPEPDIQWSKINDSLPKYRHSYDSRLLNITSVRYEDRGEYVCTAKNTVGSTQRKIEVIVQVGPKIIRRPDATEFGYLSKTKRLLFKVFSFPTANVTWRRPYWDSASDWRFQKENGSFVIENVQYTDSGLYQAVAKNLLGEVRITTFLIVRDVIIPPMLTVKPKEVMAFSNGASISLTCKAIGAPIPTVTWVNSSGAIIASEDNNFQGSKTLKIDFFTSKQRGRYTCTAENHFGKAETHVYLLSISEIRLAGSSDPYKGRVEIYQNGQWGTVCGKTWDITYANVTCKQLGFSKATYAYGYASHGQGSGPVYRLSCNGRESRLQDCSVRKEPTYSYSYRYGYCRHDRDAVVTCT